MSPIPPPAGEPVERKNEGLTRQTVEALDAHLDTLDYSAQLKLKMAREQALTTLKSAPARQRQRWLWLTAVPAALALLMLWPGRMPELPPGAGTESDSMAMVQDFDLMVAGEDLDMMQEMDLLQWLEEQES